MPLVLTDPTCAAEVAKLQDKRLYYADDPAKPREKRFVVANGVLLREGPSTDATVYQKLGYGVQVAVVARGCADGWTLVASPYGAVARGVGFIRDDLLGPSLLTESVIDAKRASAASPEDAAAWSLIEALYHPSPVHMDEAVRLQATAAAAIQNSPPLPCDTHFGACAVLARENDHGQVVVPRAIAEIAVGPWWTLSAADPAGMALFRAAYIGTSDEECHLGIAGAVCESTFEVSLQNLDGSGTSRLGASRRPPRSWFTEVSTAPCAYAEAAARASPLWVGPVAHDPIQASVYAGHCVPGEDGGAWWVQPIDLTTDAGAYRSYRVGADRTVSDRTDRVPEGLRDLDGDGDVETLWRCPWGWQCEQEARPSVP